MKTILLRWILVATCKLLQAQDQCNLNTITQEYNSDYVIATSNLGLSGFDAEKCCISTYGKHLAKFESREEENIAIGMRNSVSSLANVPCWIGLQGDKPDGNPWKWTWNDNTTCNYTNWNNGSTSLNSNDRCVLMTGNTYESHNLIDVNGKQIKSNRWINEPCDNSANNTIQNINCVICNGSNIWSNFSMIIYGQFETALANDSYLELIMQNALNATSRLLGTDYDPSLVSINLYIGNNTFLGYKMFYDPDTYFALNITSHYLSLLASYLLGNDLFTKIEQIIVTGISNFSIVYENNTDKNYETTYPAFSYDYNNTYENYETTDPAINYDYNNTYENSETTDPTFSYDNNNNTYENDETTVPAISYDYNNNTYENYETTVPTFRNKNSSLTTFDITMITMISSGLLLCCIFVCYRLYLVASQPNEAIATSIVRDPSLDIKNNNELDGIELQMNDTNDVINKEGEDVVDIVYVNTVMVDRTDANDVINNESEDVVDIAYVNTVMVDTTDTNM